MEDIKTKHVKIRWINLNPFVSLERMALMSEACLSADTELSIIEQWAKESTPDGYYLNVIFIDGLEVKKYPYPRSL